MKNISRRFFVLTFWSVGFWLLANVAAFAQEEKHYRHADGHEFSDWGQGAGGNSISLEVKGYHLSAKLVSGAGDGEQMLTWKAYLSRDEEAEVGKTKLKVTDQSVSVEAIGDGWAKLGIDPSGEYRRLTEANRLRFAKADFAAADAELNRAYGELRETLKDQPENWADVRQRQRDWIEYRDFIAEHPATIGGDVAAKDSSIGYWDMMAGLTESQTEFLEIFTGKAVPDGRDGIYVDARCGHLIIKNADAEGFDFTINVVRGPTFHLGELSGRAKIGSDGGAVFVDTEPDAFVDGKPCIIRFELKGKRIRLSGENTMYYHGARAYFDGEYFKKGDLPKSEENQQQVPQAKVEAFQAEPGVVQGWMEIAARQNRQAREEKFEVMFVGDSLTQFWEAQGEPVWLLDFAPMNAGNFGVAADRVENVLWRLQNGLLPPGDGVEADTVKLFVLMMGTNNLSATPPSSPEHVARGIEAVLDFIAARRPNAQAVLLPILPSGLLPDDAELRERITETNGLLEELCPLRERVRFLSVHDRFLDDDGRWLPGLTLDGTHLTRRGYDVLASALRPTMREILSDDGEVKSKIRK